MNAPPKIVRKVRTDHGTRVARRIVCTRCSKADTVDFAPRDPSTVLCRRCAFEQFGAIDLDDRAVRTVQTSCTECHRTYDRVVDPRDDRAPVCSDCRTGILSKQQDRTSGATRLSARIVRARRRDSSAGASE